MSATPEILDLIRRGALFVANHSGGKDSQAMLAHLVDVIPAAQLLIVHADLGSEVEWEGAIDHISANSFGLPLLIAKPVTGFFDMVERRGMFPDPARRQCTSDLKRTPIEREIRRFLKRNPQFGGLVVNCMGMRAQESASRSKLVALKTNARNSKAGREWLDWLPIHDWTVDAVFARIAKAGQTPHVIYSKGMSRFSCRFCIMASIADLTTAATLAPVHYSRLCGIEARLGHTLSPSRKTLPEITGIAPGIAA